MALDTDRWTRMAREHLLDGAEVRRRTAEACVHSIREAAEIIAQAFRIGSKVLLCGNGGSAADCQHMATDTSFLTAFSNDVGFDGVFARQVQALGRPGDVLVAISTSGRSRNVILAAETAHALKMRVVTLTGSQGWIGEPADVSITIPSEDTQYVQEAHLAVEHVLCALVEAMLFSERGRR